MINRQRRMARCVADLRLALGTVSAANTRDPRWVPAPGSTPHGRTGIDRAPEWLANTGDNVVDAEPPQISQVAESWFDAI